MILGTFNISKHIHFYFYLHTITFMTPGRIAAALLQLLGILLNSSETFNSRKKRTIQTKIWLKKSVLIKFRFT